MKENLNIEKLFKDKFENFEADVNPNLWNNIAKGVQSTATTSTTLSFGVKALIVASAVSVVGIATYYLGGFNQSIQKPHQTEIKQTTVEDNKNINKTVDNQIKPATIVAQDNDPIINSHQEEIVNELTKHQDKTEQTTDIDNSVKHSSEINSTAEKGLSNSTTLNEGNNSTNNQTTDNSTNKVNQTTNNTASTDNVEEKNIVYPSGKIEIVSNNNKFEYQFNANAINHEKVIWNFGDGESSTDENPIHVYTTPGQYEVSLTIISKDNEVYQEQQAVEIKSTSSIDNVPNVITPNGDRINDEFVIKTNNIDEFNIVIKDQNGNIMFESNDKNFVWNGTNQAGESVENGIYIYYIFAKGTDGSIFKIPGQIYVR